MTDKIFISYRRADVGGWSRLMRTELGPRLPGCEIILDVSTMKPGRNFEEAIEHSLGEVEMVLALIGADWLAELTSPKRQGKKDYMRLELETALNSGTFLIPLLIDGAVMPDPTELPESLQRLPLLHAISITLTDFDRDIDYIAATIKDALAEMKAPKVVAPPPPPQQAEKPKASPVVLLAPELLPLPNLPDKAFDAYVADPIRAAFAKLVAPEMAEAALLQLEDRGSRRSLWFTRASPVVALTIHGDALTQAENDRLAAWIAATGWKTQRGEATASHKVYRADFPMTDVERLTAVAFICFEQLTGAPPKRPPRVKFGSLDFAKYPLRLPGDRR